MGRTFPEERAPDKTDSPGGAAESFAFGLKYMTRHSRAVHEYALEVEVTDPVEEVGCCNSSCAEATEDDGSLLCVHVETFRSRNRTTPPSH